MKCEICGREATFSLSPDLDINGLGVCGEHRQEMKSAYNILVQEGEEAYKKYIEDLKSKPKKLRKV